MAYYMTHPDHGAHVCYTPEDVEAHKKRGWVPRCEQKPVEVDAKSEPPKRRGRPKKTAQ